jgi:hypothetical protein
MSRFGGVMDPLARWAESRRAEGTTRKQVRTVPPGREVTCAVVRMGNGGEGTTLPSQGKDRPPLLHRGDANQLGHSSAESVLVKLGKVLVG